MTDIPAFTNVNAFVNEEISRMFKQGIIRRYYSGKVSNMSRLYGWYYSIFGNTTPTNLGFYKKKIEFFDYMVAHKTIKINQSQLI